MPKDSCRAIFTKLCDPYSNEMCKWCDSHLVVLTHINIYDHRVGGLVRQMYGLDNEVSLRHGVA